MLDAIRRKLQQITIIWVWVELAYASNMWCAENRRYNQQCCLLILLFNEHWTTDCRTIHTAIRQRYVRDNGRLLNVWCWTRQFVGLLLTDKRRWHQRAVFKGEWLTGGWIKMPIGTEVGLVPFDIVLDWDPAPRPKGVQHPYFSADVNCGQRSPILDVNIMLC